MLTPINSQTHPLSECTANEITDYIIQEKLKPGDRLPTEAELCQEFCVSRTTIREAIRILVSRNIVTISRGVGTFISDTPGIADDPLGFKFHHDKERLFVELIELRTILEPQLARYAAENATDEEITKMEATEKAFEDAFYKHGDYKTIDESLHVMIAKATHNDLIGLILPLLVNKIDGVNTFPTVESVEVASRQHSKILRAIRERNPQMAVDAMIEHLSKHKDDFLIQENI